MSPWTFGQSLQNHFCLLCTRAQRETKTKTETNRFSLSRKPTDGWFFIILGRSGSTPFLFSYIRYQRFFCCSKYRHFNIKKQPNPDRRFKSIPLGSILYHCFSKTTYQCRAVSDLEEFSVSLVCVWKVTDAGRGRGGEGVRVVHPIDGAVNSAAKNL
jgi:hypothetical protein